MSKDATPQSLILFPANIDEILDKYEHIMASYQDSNIYGAYEQTQTKLDVLFPLKRHPIHGITVIQAVEKYDNRGYVVSYQYEWKKCEVNSFVSNVHLSAWEHDAKHMGTIHEPTTQTKLHLHYFVPGDRLHHKRSLEVQNLEQVFEFVAPFIENGEEYRP